ncbi:MAG: aldose 1-epimerase [Ferroplasma sp.]|uniref:aldose 1-epimerase n=1 Tax=Ferroplasma sp. TaxID=2591003 RepID=UPI0028166C67|nr:aldose 1-epimerase [Ferroplasma sp.]WMT50701.1 MAG: aldose 1-epimerase [Ferroplasma sp.]
MILENGKTKCSLNPMGAYLEELYIDGKSIIRKSPDRHVTHGGAAVLFPFGNRIRNADYYYGGLEYRLPENDGRNSIHGLVRDRLFNYISGKYYMEFYTYFRSKSYPGIAWIGVRYEIQENEFRTLFTVKSILRTIPVEIGFHPYFTVDGEYSIDYTGSAMELEYRDGYFPDGNYFPVNLKQTHMSKLKLDNAFMIDSDIILSDESHRVLIKRKNMPFAVIYNGEYAGGNAVAIEPMTGAPDVYHNGIGLINLEKGKTFQCSYSISLLE